MNYKITDADYKNILRFYDKPIPSKKSDLKNAAEDILALKLCSCIKKVNPQLTQKSEPRAIGICTRSVFKNKGLSRGKFKCLKARSVAFKKTQKKVTFGKSKTNKNRK
jgi:hypothetical protein